MQAIRKPRRNFYGYVLDLTRTANQIIEENFVVSVANDFIVTHIVGNATSNSYRVQFRDSINGLQWSDGLIDSQNIVGTAQLPYKLPRTKWVQKNGIIYYKVQDYSGAGNTIQLVLFGYEKYYDLLNVLDEGDIENKEHEYFAVPFSFGTVAGSATGSVKVQISSGYDFLVTHITGIKTGIYTLDIYDNVTNRHWLSNNALGQTNDVNLVGTISYPFKLPKPKYVKGGSVITMNVTDTSTANNTIEVVLHGYRIPAVPA